MNTNESSFELWETGLRQAAVAFPYPSTPDIAGAVRRRLAAEPARRAAQRRRLAWATALAILLLAGLLAVPAVRASILEFIQIGSIRIFPAPPTMTPTPTSERLAHPTQAAIALTATITMPATAREVAATPTADNLSWALNLPGAMSLSEAQAKTRFQIRLPTYPTNLDPPARVYRQDMGDSLVTLVWLEPGRPNAVYFILNEFGPKAFADKFQVSLIQETTVNGHPARWLTGPYVLQYFGNQSGRMVDAHVMIWKDQTITYRLESNLTLAEARQIAESIPAEQANTPAPAPTSSALNLAGQTTLATAQAKAGFTLKLPAYPADLGAPDQVALQQLGGELIIMVWLEPGKSAQARLVLYQMADDIIAQKFRPSVIRETSVNGKRAVWTEGEHLLEFLQNGRGVDSERRLVQGHVLMWSDGPVTYRLESTLSMDEAVRVAESLQ